MAEEELTDEQALMKIAQAMKDNNISTDDKHSVHTFLFNIAMAEDTTKTGYLRSDKDVDELGLPKHPVRTSKNMALISEKIINNEFFKEYFEKEAEITLSTSLSREGFLVRQGTTQTKHVADVTKRRKTNKGWFGSTKTEETGGDPNDTR